MDSQDLNWPNFFIVGAPKCGTTSLYEYLKQHPQVFFPKIKEQNFFSTPPPPGSQLFDLRYCGSRQEYQRLYQGAEKFVAIGDASPSYLWDEDACRRIHKVCPQAKIIIILRDPVARAYSHFLFYRMNLVEPESSFRKALELEASLQKVTWHERRAYASFGLYYEQVRRYLETFGREQVLVLLFDDLASKRKELLAQVARHIGVDPEWFERLDVSEVHNPYRMPRSRIAYRIAGRLGLRTTLIPPAVRKWLGRNPLLFDRKKPQVDAKSRRVLEELYEPDITRLEDLLGRKLPELRKSWN